MVRDDQIAPLALSASAITSSVTSTANSALRTIVGWPTISPALSCDLPATPAAQNAR